ncbi:MAG TPA: NADP-dependent oxidoreductase [Polyangiaceae bacterium]
MKAVVLTSYGDVNKLEVRDLPEPTAGPNEIKVRMAGASINPVDWKLRSGALQAMMPLVLPAILGRDASGEVVAIGPGVTRFKIGSRVMGLVMGAYAEFVVAATDAWAEVPTKMDLVDAAALPLVLLTGAQLIEEAVQPHQGEVVLVTGAVGCVGRVAIFAAKARGAKVWAGVRGAQKEAAAKLGADGVVALDDDAEIDKLPPLDGIADTIGGATIAKLLGKVKPGGTIGSVVGDPLGAKGRGLIVRGMLTHPDPERLAVLARAVGDGKLVIPIVRKLPLSQAREAQALAEHHSGGKVILTGSLHVREPVRATRDHASAANHGR